MHSTPVNALRVVDDVAVRAPRCVWRYGTDVLCSRIARAEHVANILYHALLCWTRIALPNLSARMPKGVPTYNAAALFLLYMTVRACRLSRHSAHTYISQSSDRTFSAWRTPHNTARFATRTRTATPPPHHLLTLRLRLTPCRMDRRLPNVPQHEQLLR